MEESALNIIGSIASISAIPLAIIIAIIQTIRLKDLQKREYREIWNTVKDIRGLMDITRELRNDNNSDKGAHEWVKAMFRQQIRSASNLEKKYTIHTIKNWVNDDKISGTDWQKGIAKSYLKN